MTYLQTNTLLKACRPFEELCLHIMPFRQHIEISEENIIS